MSHYFTNDPTLKSQTKAISIQLAGISLALTTDRGIFAKGHLDLGTKILLENINLGPDKSVLDMGCGNGIVGIFLAKRFQISHLVLADVNQRALVLAKQNLAVNAVIGTVIESDFYAKITQQFDYVVCNPPIRIGKELLYEFYRKTKNQLNDHGQLWLVVNKKHGAESTYKFLSSIYTTVSIVSKHKGFIVFMATMSKST